MADLGVILGLTGIGTGVVSIVYARAQVSAARHQAKEAAHMTRLASSQHLFERFHDARDRVAQTPHLVDEVRDHVPGLAPVMKVAGGYAPFIVMREVCELFQDAYYLRKSGIMTSAYWADFRGNFVLWAYIPTFRAVFAFSSEKKLLSEEFVAFFGPALKGESVGDPVQTAP